MLYILLLLIVAVVAFLVFVYNNLVKLKNKVDEGWADIDTQLKRRYDLLPNLVETVKGYAAHESQTFENVVQARSAAMNAQTVAEKEQAENMITGALKTIFALAENYPDLKANQNFLNLQNTLKEIEEHIQMSRRYYNGTVRDFNTTTQIFPNNLVASKLGFKDREFFQANEEEKQNVAVNFTGQQPPTAPVPPTPPPAAPAPMPMPPTTPPTNDQTPPQPPTV
ncbi:LemA family protein [Candidatus Gracilibacteria bacterium]|nr:LemA family protein [Candidatus Gracilibacteria bacterium]